MDRELQELREKFPTEFLEKFLRKSLEDANLQEFLEKVLNPWNNWQRIFNGITKEILQKRLERSLKEFFKNLLEQYL